jgi:flagellar hook protein FlgE
VAASPSGTTVDGFSLTVNGKTGFNTNFSFSPTTIPDGGTASSSQMRAFADETDLLSEMYNSNGVSLGLDTFPTSLALGGAVGGDPLAPPATPITATSTLGDIAQELQYALNINSNPVEVNDKGQIVVRGEVGTSTAIGDISVQEDGVVNSALENAFAFTQTQQASDQKDFSMATTVYDSLGGEHTIAFSFEKVPGQNEWVWQANTEGGETILNGGSGRMRFSDTGSISNFSFDDGSSALTFQPQRNGTEGAANVTLDVDYGEIGALTGLTQFEGTGNLQSIADGFGTGTLVDYSIDQAGIITGIFSNDTAQSIARIGMASFSNADGLTRDANNTYRRSGNSGQAIEMFAGDGNGVSLVPGALETSNVDLAKEFTNLVVAQRAFQANSRVITTADQVMQELVNLVR